MCGVYYLFDGAAVLYVGASRQVERRIAEHRFNRLNFSGYFVDECPEPELDKREAAAIAEFDPPWNNSANLRA
jgi:hypothetical protein